MNRNKHLISLTLALLLTTLLFYSCDTNLVGDQLENQPPSTNLTVDEINRSGDDRLSSQITISWWGDDPDGYVDGYEYTFNNDTTNADWTFTNKTDSTFILPIPFGQDTADVVFRVRSIDNDGLRDPDGASLAYPVKNTPPTIEFTTLDRPADTMYHYASFGWNANDLDGDLNLRQVEISVNDTTDNWIDLDPKVDFVTLYTPDQSQSQVQAEIYLGRGFDNSNRVLQGLNIEASNEFYVRVQDQAGVYSNIDTVSWYTKRQTSNILVINDYASDADIPNALEHVELLKNQGIQNIDYWQFNNPDIESGVQTLPNLIEPQLPLTFAEWDYIYWVSNSLAGNLQNSLLYISEFINSGGKLLVVAPSTKIDENGPLTDLLPIQRNIPLPEGENATTFKTFKNREFTAVDTTVSLDLGSAINSNSLVPFEASGKAIFTFDFYYEVLGIPFNQNRDFEGNETIAAINSTENILFFGFDLLDMNQDGDIDELMNYLLINQLNYEVN